MGLSREHVRGEAYGCCTVKGALPIGEGMAWKLSGKPERTHLLDKLRYLINGGGDAWRVLARGCYYGSAEPNIRLRAKIGKRVETRDGVEESEDTLEIHMNLLTVKASKLDAELEDTLKSMLKNGVRKMLPQTSRRADILRAWDLQVIQEGSLGFRLRVRVPPIRSRSGVIATMMQREERMQKELRNLGRQEREDAKGEEVRMEGWRLSARRTRLRCCGNCNFGGEGQAGTCRYQRAWEKHYKNKEDFTVQQKFFLTCRHCYLCPRNANDGFSLRLGH